MDLLNILPIESWNTIYMVFAAAIIATIVGLPLGIILYVTNDGGLSPHRICYSILSWTVNIGRSFPFAILMVALIPLTRLILGTSLGTTASIVPLSIAAAPFIARLFEQTFSQVDRQTIEATLLMGATPLQIIVHILIPEAIVGLIQSFTTTVVTLIGYSAMAGMVGGGGLGKVAIQYGYLRFNTTIMVLTIILLVALVQLVQFIGSRIVSSIQIRRGIIKT